MRRNIDTKATNRCKCCLEEDDLKDIWKEHDNEGEQEIYGDMIRDCFVVPWYPPNNKSEYICKSCIIRLRVAVSFKKGMLVSEQTLKEYFDEESEAIVKLEEESDVDIETEYLSIEYLEDEDSLDDVKKEIKIEVNESDTKVSSYKTKDKYTQEDLNKCLEAVRSKTMTQVEASVIYDIPRRVISETLSMLGCPPRKGGRQRDPILIKSQENLDIIIENTNLTPFANCGVRGFECFFCLETFQKPGDLKIHTLQEHAGKKMYKVYCAPDRSVKLDVTGLRCRICNENIPTFDKIFEHLKQKHDKKFHIDAYKNLVPFKFEDDILSCYVCSEEFVSFQLLNNHINLNHFKNFECEKCGRGFINKKSLQAHKLRHKIGTFGCRYCEKVFSTRVRQLDHERSVHRLNSKRNRCAFCGLRFSDMVKKKDHEVRVHNAPKQTFDCQACSKVYDSQRSLQRHVKSFHLMLRPFKCEECGSAFYKRVDLRKHMVKHTGLKQFKCSVCLKSYGRKNTLREHMRIHENDRRFKCDQCGQTFVQKCSWRGHMRAKHDQLVWTHCTVSKIQNKPRPANKDIFNSKMFPELTNFGKDLGVILEFSNATPINYHRGFSYKCCYCSSEFKEPTDLKQHTIDCHDEKTRSGLIQGNYSASYAVKLDITNLLCTVCDKSIESLNELIDHLSAAHEKTIHEKIKNYILPFKFDGVELRCVVCESVFYKMKFLQEHMNVHYRNFICDHCDSGFVARTILVGHIKRHAVGCFKCVFCSKPFDTAQKKHLHERVVHYRVLKKCIHCVRMFSTYEKREEHLVQEHGHRSVTFSCQSCDKVFSTNRHLNKHIKRDHLLERRHQCKECDMTFFRGVELKQHMVKHTGIKEFECHICHKSYVRIGTLRVHMRHSHGSSVDPTHESGFECEQCGETFAQRCAFRGHMRTQHHRNIST